MDWVYNINNWVGNHNYYALVFQVSILQVIFSVRFKLSVRCVTFLAIFITVHKIHVAVNPEIVPAFAKCSD